MKLIIFLLFPILALANNSTLLSEKIHSSYQSIFKIFDGAYSIDCSSPQKAYQLSRAFYFSGEYEKCIKLANTCKDADKVFNQAASCALKLFKYDQALSFHKKAILSLDKKYIYQAANFAMKNGYANEVSSILNTVNWGNDLSLISNSIIFFKNGRLNNESQEQNVKNFINEVIIKEDHPLKDTFINLKIHSLIYKEHKFQDALQLLYKNIDSLSPAQLFIYGYNVFFKLSDGENFKEVLDVDDSKDNAKSLRFRSR